jgi:hypothetical protein
VPAQPGLFGHRHIPRMKNILKNPYIQGFLVVVVSLVVLGVIRPYTSKIPVVGKYL